MTSAFSERRQNVGELPQQVKDALGVDRRQFPQPADMATLTPEARKLQETIDTYKIQHGVKRITVVELLDLLDGLGYRRT